MGGPLASADVIACGPWGPVRLGHAQVAGSIRGKCRSHHSGFHILAAVGQGLNKQVLNQDFLSWRNRNARQGRPPEKKRK